jgi:hypothetical protein
VIKKVIGLLMVLVILGSMATAVALTANKENKNSELKLPEELTKKDL